jgi:hypothetical protein
MSCLKRAQWHHVQIRLEAFKFDGFWQARPFWERWAGARSELPAQLQPRERAWGPLSLP